jgi:signal transduction histidine kinase
MPLFTRKGDYSANVRLPRQRFGYGITKVMDDDSRIVIVQDITEKRELDSRREALSHTISHDLRNPLSAIGGFAELVAKFGEVTPQQEKYITRIRQTASKIHDMAKPLVDLAWIEAGMPLAHRPVQMSDTINQAVKELGVIALSHKVTIVVSVQTPMPLIMGDPERMHIVVYNLLHNAIIYSNEEQPVVIHAWSDEQEVFCSVADQGIGISDDELEQVFDRMYRSRDERVRETPGGGLGLTIARTIVERHGGDMWAASTLGDGSTFTFVLPTAQKE